MKCKVIKPCMIEVLSGEVEVTERQFNFAKGFLEIIKEEKKEEKKKSTKKK